MKSLFRRMFQTSSQTPEITFRCKPELKDILPPPVRASKAMPEWYKKVEKRIPNSELSNPSSVKGCVPVLDAVSQGYIIPLWADLHVKVTEKVINEDGDKAFHIWFKFPNGSDFGVYEQIGSHAWEQVGEACDLKKFELGRVLMKFGNPWTIETPKGWSVYFKNPANNWSNDIELIEAVVDTDEYKSKVNLPYVWKGSELGEWIIPKGTPLAQVIPFKRIETEMSIKEEDEDKVNEIHYKMGTLMNDKYRNLFWHKAKKS